MGTFPNEVWLEIFKRIDIESLMKLRLVCHQFYDVIEYLLNKHQEWQYILNHKTILIGCLVNTIQRAYPYVLVTHWWNIDDPLLARGTYLSYMKWQKILVNPHTQDTIVPQSNLGHISCICTFDKYIAIAFESGLIANYTIDNISQPFYLADHGTRVMQVEFWYSNGELLLVSVGEGCALKFLDIENKIEIATDGFFANSISFGECRHFRIGDMGGILTSYERVEKHISLGPTLNLELRVDEQLIAHAVYGQYMKAMTLKEGSIILIRYKGVIQGGRLIQFEKIQKHRFCMLRKKLGASLLRLIMTTEDFIYEQPQDLITTTPCRNVASRSSRTIWYVFNLVQHFECNATSMALHADILMFGLEDGSIHLLHIPHYIYDPDLEKDIRDSKKIEVDTEPIVDLTVLEVDKKPCIVAFTKQKVHLINFF